MNTVENKVYLNYSDVLIKPRYSTVKSRQDVVLAREFYGHESKHKFYATPFMITNMDTVGTVEMALAVQEYGVIVCLHKFLSATEVVNAFVQKKLNLNHFISAGMSDKEHVRLIEIEANLEKAGLKMPPILLDVANGYTETFQNYIQDIRKSFPNTFIAAGNIATPEEVAAYAAVGVDAVRIGIGPGGQCRTRETAGVGIPQLTAVMECAEAAREYGLLTIADGGINEFADFSKALVAGADFVCAGSIFAGSDEAKGKVVWKNIPGEPFKQASYKAVYGMSSDRAMKTFFGSTADYRASEGRVSEIPTTGSVVNTIKDIMGSVRSTMTYTDSKNLEQLWLNGIFIRVGDTINRKYEKFTIGI